MYYIEDEGVKFAVTKEFKISYERAKNGLKKAKERVKKAKNNLNLSRKNEKKGLIQRILIDINEIKFEKDQAKFKVKNEKFKKFKNKYNALKEEAKQTPKLQKAKIKYPSIGNSVSAYLDKKKRKRNLALIALATPLSAAAIFFSAGLIIPAAAIIITGAAIFGLKYRGLKKYEKTELKVKEEEATNTKAEAKRRKKTKISAARKNSYKNSRKTRQSIDPPGLTIDEINANFNTEYNEARYEVAKTQRDIENPNGKEIEAYNPESEIRTDFFDNFSSTKVSNPKEDITFLPPGYNPDYKETPKESDSVVERKLEHYSESLENYYGKLSYNPKTPRFRTEKDTEIDLEHPKKEIEYSGFNSDKESFELIIPAFKTKEEKKKPKTSSESKSDEKSYSVDPSFVIPDTNIDDDQSIISDITTESNSTTENFNAFSSTDKMAENNEENTSYTTDTTTCLTEEGDSKPAITDGLKAFANRKTASMNDLNAAKLKNGKRKKNPRRWKSM